jgi:hypothetical protein
MSSPILRHDEHPESLRAPIMTPTTPTTTPKTAAPPHKVDRKSGEYLVKSGIAGGIAGCAVR